MSPPSSQAPRLFLFPRPLQVEGPWPKRVLFEFDMSIDDPDFILLTQQDGTLKRLRPPPVGGTVTLRWEQQLMGR